MHIAILTFQGFNELDSLIALGVLNRMNQPFFARGNVATAGGCLASCYLAGWIIARSLGIDAATEALHYVAPVGEKEAFVANAPRNIEPYLQDSCF